jgi:ribosomal protein L11
MIIKNDDDILDPLNKFSICLRIGSIESGPPLSTILGNFGINTIKFVKDLNDYTSELPTYFLLVVNVVISSDRTYKFNISEPSVTQFLRILSKKKQIFILSQGGYKTVDIKVIDIRDVFFISRIKFNNEDESSLRMLYGSISSLDMYISYENENENENE